MTKIFYKKIFETTLLLCSSCVIFTGTVSAVLLMLAWPNDRILGLSTRLVITLSFILVLIASVGFFGTLIESTRFLLLYASLLILFPVTVLLVEIILRLSTMSPTVSATELTPTESLSVAGSTTPKSTLIFSNSFTSNSAGQPYSPPILSERNFSSANSISASSAPPLNALLPLPSFNLSTRSPQPTDFYLLFKDGYLDADLDSQSKQARAKAPPVASNPTEESAVKDTGQQTPKSTFLKSPQNFWSDILTTSLSPRVETLVEYVLIGMLAFVLLQIAIAYLLASEIRSLRSELAMLTSMPFDKSNYELEETERPNLQVDGQEAILRYHDKESLPSNAYCQLQCFEPSQSTLPLRYTSAEPSANYEPDFCLVQVHATDTPILALAAERANSFNSNYVNVIIDETLASTASSSALTSKTNRRNRMGSFRVTFDSAPEYFEANSDCFAGEPTSSSNTAPLAPSSMGEIAGEIQQQPLEHYQTEQQHQHQHQQQQQQQHYH